MWILCSIFFCRRKRVSDALGDLGEVHERNRRDGVAVRLSQLLVGVDRRRPAIAVTFKAPVEDRAVLEAGVHALPEERHHRVGRVADERHLSAARPGLQRIVTRSDGGRAKNSSARSGKSDVASGKLCSKIAVRSGGVGTVSKERSPSTGSELINGSPKNPLSSGSTRPEDRLRPRLTAPPVAALCCELPTQVAGHSLGSDDRRPRRFDLIWQDSRGPCLKIREICFHNWA